MSRKAIKPVIFTIFGASGDLAKTKIYPALYHLAKAKKMPKDFHIIGFARSPMTDPAFRAVIEESITAHVAGKRDVSVVKQLLERTQYVQGQYSDQDDFARYQSCIKTLTKKKAATNIAYFSVPPSVFEDIIRNMAATRGSIDDDIRLVIEKPFGQDKQSAAHLFHFVSQFFREEQIYLLDHYLGKSAVRSILQLRQSNRILSHMMRGSEIANIQITAFEERGVDDRGGYFDQVGMTKDMVQSHLLQILALVTMSIPVKKNPTNLQREKYSILSAIECVCDKSNVVFGQYKSYQKKKTAPKTETFAALRLQIDREEWYRVPVYIRTGKKLHKKHTYIVIELKKYPFQSADEQPNRVIIELQPSEQVHLTLINKHEGIQGYQEIMTSDSIACGIDGCLPEHATLLSEILAGEKLHFLSFPEILACWNLVDQVDAVIKGEHVPMSTYRDGSTGPIDQHTLTAKDNFSWYDLSTSKK